jgi:hypothetical protein
MLLEKSSLQLLAALCCFCFLDGGPRHVLAGTSRRSLASDEDHHHHPPSSFASLFASCSINSHQERSGPTRTTSLGLLVLTRCIRLSIGSFPSKQCTNKHHKI